MKCDSACPYSIREDDTSGRYLGLEKDITYYSCGFLWPRKQFICRVAYGADPNAECVQELNQIPEEPKRITPNMLESRKIDDEFKARDLEAGLPVDICGS